MSESADLREIARSTRALDWKIGLCFLLALFACHIYIDFKVSAMESAQAAEMETLSSRVTWWERKILDKEGFAAVIMAVPSEELHKLTQKGYDYEVLQIPPRR